MAPSSQPPRGCVSECEPTSSAGPGLRERPNTLPTPSMVASNPASSYLSHSQRLDAMSASVKVGRTWQPPAAGEGLKTYRIYRTAGRRSLCRCCGMAAGRLNSATTHHTRWVVEAAAACGSELAQAVKVGEQPSGVDAWHPAGARWVSRRRQPRCSSRAAAACMP
jgi:hypothetical protein